MEEPNESSRSIESGSVGGPARGKTWQNSSDGALRRTVFENALQLCEELYYKKHQEPLSAELQQELRDFVKAVDEALYRVAATREEYADQVSLEGRFRTAVQLIISIGQKHKSQSMSTLANFVPPPGSTVVPSPWRISVPRVASAMMPSPGSAATMVPSPVMVRLMRLVEDLNFGSDDQ